jgi:hypothetical protein
MWVQATPSLQIACETRRSSAGVDVAGEGYMGPLVSLKEHVGTLSLLRVCLAGTQTTSSNLAGSSCNDNCQIPSHSDIIFPRDVEGNGLLLSWLRASLMHASSVLVDRGFGKI